jgi:hypothetical protein
MKKMNRNTCIFTQSETPKTISSCNITYNSKSQFIWLTTYPSISMSCDRTKIRTFSERTRLAGWCTQVAFCNYKRTRGSNFRPPRDLCGFYVAAFAPALATVLAIGSLSTPPCSLWSSRVLPHARTCSLAQLSAFHTAGFGCDNWETAVERGHGADSCSMLELQAIYGSLTQIPLCPTCSYTLRSSLPFLRISRPQRPAHQLEFCFDRFSPFQTGRHEKEVPRSIL